jgi:hypothetical protein
MIDIATGKTDVSDHALRRMKKECVVELFRETESKLHGATAGHNMFESATLTEIQELNDQNDDLLIQEAMNHKTIQELNESNKKLMEKINFYVKQKESTKRKENKINDYFDKGLIEQNNHLEKQNLQLISDVAILESEMEKLKETFKLGSECAEDVHNSFHKKIQCLEKQNKELIEECKNKNETNEKLEEDLVQSKAQMEENYKDHYDQLEPVLLENEKLREDDKRIRCKNRDLQLLLQETSTEFMNILSKYPNPNVNA